MALLAHEKILDLVIRSFYLKDEGPKTFFDINLKPYEKSFKSVYKVILLDSYEKPTEQLIHEYGLFIKEPLRSWSKSKKAAFRCYNHFTYDQSIILLKATVTGMDLLEYAKDQLKLCSKFLKHQDNTASEEFNQLRLKMNQVNHLIKQFGHEEEIISLTIQDYSIVASGLFKKLALMR